MLTPPSDEVLHLLKGWAGDFPPDLFSKLLRCELEKLGLNKESVLLIEAQCVLQDYGNEGELRRLELAVRKHLNKRGYRVPRGKRTEPRLAALVKGLVPLLLASGVPLRSSERSKLTRALGLIASELDIHGEVRNEVRKLIAEDRRCSELARQAVFLAVLEGIKPDN